MFDPINEVKEVLGVFYMSNISNHKFQIEVPIAQYEYFLSQKIRSHELELRCFRLDDLNCSQLTWPDQVAVSVNNRHISEIHGLDLNSSLKKRKDAAVVLTEFIAFHGRNLRDDQPAQAKIGV
jgi:hypothetical protein